MRHRDLSKEELAALLQRNAASLWKDMDKSFKGYAANVPHAAIITSDGRIDPKYLTFPRTTKTPEQLKLAASQLTLVS
jgi:hypothetical protein